MITEGVVHGVYKVLTQSCFSMIRGHNLQLSCCALESTSQWRLSAIKIRIRIRHKVSGGTGLFTTVHHKFTYEPQTVVQGMNCPMPLIKGYTASRWNDTPNIVTYATSLEVLSLASQTSYHVTYRL